MSELTNIMQHRIVVLEQLLMVSGKQLKLVQCGDINMLLQVLARKQHYLDKLEDLERALDPFRDIAPEARQWDDAQDRGDCSRATTRCEELLAAIMELDLQSETTLAELKRETQSQLQKLENGTRAASAYAKQNVPAQPSHRTSASRLDLKTE